LRAPLGGEALAGGLPGDVRVLTEVLLHNQLLPCVEA
jgi:hypothetical protein